MVHACNIFQAGIVMFMYDNCVCMCTQICYINTVGYPICYGAR